MKQVVLKLTDEQFARLQLVAKLLDAKSDDVAVAITFSDLDSWSGDWNECGPIYQDALEQYADEKRASDRPIGKRIEDTAPSRQLRRIGYKPEVAHA